MQPKNIVIYIMDCLRPDFLGCYGFDKSTSPNIDKLAKDGVVFKRAYTTGTWTKPVATPLVTGIHPSCLESQSQSLAFGGYQYFLQKIAKEKGFKTRVFGTNLYFSKAFGFTEGFEEEVELDALEKIYQANPSNKEVANKIDWETTSTIPSQYLHELFYKKFNPAENNFTVFWSMDAHSPYYVKGDKSYFGNSLSEYLEGETYFWQRNRLATRIQKFFRLLFFNLFGIYDKKRMEKVKLLYCDAVRYNDEKMGELVSYLKEKGEYDNTLFILFGDHGESFMEHGEYGHCSSPYNEIIKIPLIIKFPGQEYAGKEVKETVSILDVYPTILELLGVQGSPEDIDGFSLLDYLKGVRKDGERKIFIESLYKTDLYSAILVKGNKKYFKMEPRGNWLRRMIRKVSFFPNWFTEKEFDLENDPQEKKGSKKISLELKKDFEEMRKSYYGRVKRYQNYKREMVDNAKIFERLRNLGYF